MENNFFLNSILFLMISFNIKAAEIPLLRENMLPSEVALLIHYSNLTNRETEMEAAKYAQTSLFYQNTAHEQTIVRCYHEGCTYKVKAKHTGFMYCPQESQEKLKRKIYKHYMNTHKDDFVINLESTIVLTARLSDLTN